MLTTAAATTVFAAGLAAAAVLTTGLTARLASLSAAANLCVGYPAGKRC